MSGRTDTLRSDTRRAEDGKRRDSLRLRSPSSYARRILSPPFSTARIVTEKPHAGNIAVQKVKGKRDGRRTEVQTPQPGTLTLCSCDGLEGIADELRRTFRIREKRTAWKRDQAQRKPAGRGRQICALAAFEGNAGVDHI